jgi:hypothetical protein
MFEKFYRQVVRLGYITGLFLLIISLPNSKYGMSMSQFFLASAFALDRVDIRRAGEFFRTKPVYFIILLVIPYLLFLLLESIYKGFKAFVKNKPALIFSSILLVHVIGLIFTIDFDYALKDLRTKLPIFLLPLFICTSQAFGKKQFYWFLFIFITALLVRTLINSWYLFFAEYIDIRDISKSVSHIIIALLVSFSIFTLGYFIRKKREFSIAVKIIFGLVLIWFLIYLIITKSATGLIISGVTFFILLFIVLLRSKNKLLKTGLYFFLIAFSAGICLYLYIVIHDYYTVNQIDLSKLEQYSTKGNKYIHNTKDLSTENGNYLWIYIQWDEMRETWNKRSNIPFDSLDKKNHLIINTLVRFLTSKGLRKDADGVNSLSCKEVEAIENGVGNVIFIDEFSFRGRIYEFLWGYDEYLKTGNPTGSTTMQRIEFWKASFGIIRDNWLTGVGTGDMNEAFQQEYEKMHSKLAPDQRWRSHNQFLSIFVGFGVIGLIWFLFAIFYPPITTRKFNDYFFLIFFIIALLSMIPGDTIESQAGVTFFSFFYSFLLFGRKEEEPYEIVKGSRFRS